MKADTQKVLTLGITGGIGSGKTSVCRVFAILGVPVFSADIEAKEILEHDEEIMKSINSITGRDLYSNGALDRPGLAALIFNDKNLLGKVNSLIHPVVIEHFNIWVKEQTSPYVIMEAAILFESGAAEMVDFKATVVAPEEERICRVIRRNKLARDEVVARMKNQTDDETRIKHSDFVIPNSENDMIIPAVLEIHTRILNRIKGIY